MRATVLHATRDIRLDDVDDPQLIDDGDAVVRVVAACICGSDLWPYRGLPEIDGPRRIGHEFVGIVEAVGSAVQTVSARRLRHRPVRLLRQHLSACASAASTRPASTAATGATTTATATSPTAARASVVRVPLADGTLVATPGAAGRGAHPPSPDAVRRVPHRPPCRRERRRHDRQHRGRRRRRRRRPVGRARRQATRRGARRGHVPARGSPADRPRVRRRRDRRRAGQGGRGRGARDLRRHRAPTRCSSASAPPTA